ncbi:MAG: radical SAM protein, partial [Polyangia bacterium]
MTVKNSESTHLTDSFSQYIRVITNAAELLDQELRDTPKDIIVTGDYQPLDARFRLSRALLQTCLNHGFPTAVVSKSPGVVRDLDLVCEIGRKSWACLAFSIGYLQSDGYWRIFEPYAPSIESRFRAMRRASDAGIYVGTALIPVLPFITDSDDQLAVIIKRTRDSGGQFVLAGGLVLGADVRTEFYRSLERMGGSPLVNRYQRLYGG